MAQQSSLFGNLPQLNPVTKEQNKSIVKKASGPKESKQKSVTVRGGGNKFATRVQAVVEIAKEHLDSPADYELITEGWRLEQYVTKMIENGIGALDTETTGLDPIDDKLVGLCLYTPGELPAYAPMHHTDFSEKEFPNQVTDLIAEHQMRRLAVSDTKLIYHNAKFDIRIVRNNLGVFLDKPFWDTSLAGNFLNENEPHKLKYLWNKYINKGKKKEGVNFDELFEKIPSNYLPVETFFIYAAGDPFKTFELFEFQYRFLNPDSPECIQKNLVGAALLLRDTEIPLIPILCNMEDEGITIDEKKAGSLSRGYNKILTIYEKRCQKFIAGLDFSTLHPDKRSKLNNPVNIGSPTQLAIILYDVLNLDSVDKDKPRGTGEDIIEELKAATEDAAIKQFLSDILEYRGTAKLLSTYVDKMPAIVKSKTGRLHGQFNQYGAKTGRFSSSDPNLQNIPSHNKQIRKMFTAKAGHVLISADYSQQEPRVLAHLCYMFGDSSMKEAYETGKDLYAWIASEVYKVPYDECKEFFPDGNKNPAGKKRRDAMKSVVLGLMYGRGAQAIADQLGWTKAEATEIVKLFFGTFPAVEKVILNFQEMAKTEGYVPTVWERKRRLPDIQLPLYMFEKLDGGTVDQGVIDYFWNRIKDTWSNRKKQAVKDEARSQGIRIIDNGAKIADAERQVLNSIIQGTSADITKRAMVLIGQNEEFKLLGGQMLLTVHDEVISQAPKENAIRCAQIMREMMLKAADKIQVPMKVDVEITERWYGEDITKELVA